MVSEQVITKSNIGTSMDRLSCGEIKKNMVESELEIKELRDQVCVLQERERDLQMQLLEYYGLKEREHSVKELESCLNIISNECKIFELKAQSLQAENQRLQDQNSNYSIVVAELDIARKTAILLREQMKRENELAKAQLASIREHVSTLMELERQSREGGKEIQKKLQKFHELENETAALRSMNERLRQEKMDLVMKLESANVKSCDSNSIEVKSLGETTGLRESNKKSVKEIERFQMNQRGINSCLRYDLVNFPAEPERIIARNLHQNLIPKSEEKAKKPMIEYACSGGDLNYPDFDSDYYSASCTITDPNEFDDLPVEHRSDKPDNSSKNNIFQKIRRLLPGKHRSQARRNSDSWSDWNRRSVSRSLTDEMQVTDELPVFCSKSLRMDAKEFERITKKSRELADPDAVSRTMSDIPRGRQPRIRPVGEGSFAQQLNFETTDFISEIMDEGMKEERKKINERQFFSENVELLKVAELVDRSHKHSIDHKNNRFSSF